MNAWSGKQKTDGRRVVSGKWRGYFHNFAFCLAFRTSTVAIVALLDYGDT